MYSKYVRSGSIDVSQGWHLLTLRFDHQRINLSVDGGEEIPVPSSYPIAKSTFTENYSAGKPYAYESNVFWTNRRFIRGPRFPGQGSLTPIVTDDHQAELSQPWFTSKLVICANGSRQNKFLKADIAEVIALPTTSPDDISNYLINKWDIERA
jgi:hypothetical protein